MARQVLNNLDAYGIQRGKINENFLELYTVKLEEYQVLTRTNTSVYAPTNPYHPATKQYADGLRNTWDAIYDPTGVNADAFDRVNHYGEIDAIYVAEDGTHRFVSDAEKATWNAKEPGIGAKGTAFNKDFGTVSGSVAVGDHNHTGTYEPANVNIQSHIADVVTNPHQVTKALVGLGSADDTADAVKEVSAPQQAALDLKANTTDVTAALELKQDRAALVADIIAAFPYNYSKIADYVVGGDVYEEVDRLEVFDNPAGVYEIRLAINWELNTTINSAFFRFSLDGGGTWTEWTMEPADNTDKRPFSYFFPQEFIGGDYTIIVEARRENAADIMLINFMDITFARVG